MSTFREFSQFDQRRIQSSFTIQPMKIGPVGVPQLLVPYYFPVLHNSPDNRKFNLHHGGSLRSDSTFLLDLNCNSPAQPSDTDCNPTLYEGNSISKLQIQVATYVFELSAGNCHRQIAALSSFIVTHNDRYAHDCTDVAAVTRWRRP